MGADQGSDAGSARFGRRDRSRQPVVRRSRALPLSGGRPPSYALISTARAHKKVSDSQAIGRSRGGLSTKIHTLVDALGNPIGFHLTGGEAHDLVGADQLLAGLKADALIADKAFDAEKRVIDPLTAAGKTAVIPPKSNRRKPRTLDRELYKARHLIENFFAKLKQPRHRHALRQDGP
jgi:transposase